MLEVCVKILAKLLRYKLKILTSHSNLDSEIQSFDEELGLGANHRGSLVLITGLPRTCKGNVFAGRHRFILCYESLEKSHAAR